MGDYFYSLWLNKVESHLGQALTTLSAICFTSKTIKADLRDVHVGLVGLKSECGLTEM